MYILKATAKFWIEIRIREHTSASPSINDFCQTKESETHADSIITVILLSLLLIVQSNMWSDSISFVATVSHLNISGHIIIYIIVRVNVCLNDTKISSSDQWSSASGTFRRMRIDGSDAIELPFFRFQSNTHDVLESILHIVTKRLSQQ